MEDILLLANPSGAGASDSDSCGGLIVAASNCCQDSYCCQGVGNGATALNCGNVKIKSLVDVFAISSFDTKFLCNSEECSAGQDCITVFGLKEDKILDAEVHCCDSQDNGSFLCGNQVYCNQQAINEKKGNSTKGRSDQQNEANGNDVISQQICCSGNCNDGSVVTTEPPIQYQRDTYSSRK